jgi:DNA-binding beta-propeller fold protein YncE
MALPGGDIVRSDAGFFFSAAVLSGDSLYALESLPSQELASRVVRVDLGTERIVATRALSGASNLAVGDGTIWVAINAVASATTGGITRLVQLARDTLNIRGDLTLPGRARSDDVIRADGSLWALSGRDAIRVDAATGRITRSVRLTVPPSVSRRSLAVSEDGTRLYVGWVTTRQVNGVTEFDAASGRVLYQNPRVGGGPLAAGPALAYDGARLWVTFATGNLGVSIALHSSDLTRAGETVAGPNSMAVLPEGNVVWVSRADRIDCVSTHNKTLASYGLPDSGGGLVAVTAATIYIETSEGITVTKPSRACQT